ncbi:serine/threonine protein kinase [Chondromyces crocatus]|uniref:serine/threonine protein kinase n=1 Tax=Chondromyces crocatus TaxID=52 RepID=UPI0012E2A1F9|nr:serine/threonine-protein kinase [Chondromyces crocatus]
MASPSFAPELFGDFLLVQRLARSPMAEVLLAVRLGDRSGRTFVVKRPVLGERASGRAAQAISREAEVLEAVRVPGLPALEAAGAMAGLPYIAQEHVRGVPLDELLARVGRLPSVAAAAVGRDLARALSALHAAGWVHGDVTPSNVIVDDAGEARLLDLGIARHIGERRAEVAGKPGYVAPEAALPGAASTAEDAFGLGVVLAECVLGRRLFPERDLVEAAARADTPREVATLEQALPGLSPALARRPEQRPSLTVLCERLEQLPVDRGVLADLVARASEPVSPDLTPTAPMVVAGRVERTLVDADLDASGEGRPTSDPLIGGALAGAALAGSADARVTQAQSALTPAEYADAARAGASFAEGVTSERSAREPFSAEQPVDAHPLARANGTHRSDAAHGFDEDAVPAPPRGPAPSDPARAGRVPLDVDGGARAGATAASPAPAAPRLPWVALTLAFTLVLIVGVLLGRSMSRQGPGKLSIGGPLPRRAQIELDGKPFSMPIGDAAPLSPGSHTLAIVLPRGVRREYTFQVRPNEHIVILQSNRREDLEGEGSP